MSIPFSQRKPVQNALKILLSFGLISALSGCQVGKFSAVDDMANNSHSLKDPRSPEPPLPVPKRPSIDGLTASPSTISAGQSSTLNFAVSGATTVRLNPGNLEITGTTSKTVNPATTTVYTLTATNSAGSTSQNVTVTVTAAPPPPPPSEERPSITSFTATPASITAGDNATLRFAAERASSLRIEPGGIVVTGSSSTVVRPTADTTYTLTATNSAGSVSRTVAVTVTAAPPPVSGGEECLRPDFEPLSKASRGAVKFYPGHYVHIAKSRTGDPLAQALTEINSLPNMKGVLKRYAWSDIEREKDRYDLTQINQDLAAVEAKGKKLVVMIMYKYDNSSGGNAMPSYLATMGDGQYYFTLGGDGTGPFARGTLARFDKDYVRDRFLAFMKGIKSLDRHPALAAIVFPETALSVSGVSLDVQDKYYQGLMRIDQSTACLFRETPVIQMTNFPFRLLKWMTDNYKKYAISMGGPDVVLNDTALSGPGKAYTYYPLLESTLPIGVIVASSNYMYNNHEDMKAGIKNGLAPAEAIRQLAAFANERLKTNYIFWKKDWAGDVYYQALIKAAQDRTLPELDKVCPSVYVCR